MWIPRRIADDKSNVYFEADKYEIASQATRLLCLDKDKTLSLFQRDTEVEESISKQEMRGRNVASLPRSLFVYDYDLKLKKIINMPFPMLRLCGDVETNTVYAMSVNPEFELIKIEL